jgi:hypothetical protein
MFYQVKLILRGVSWGNCTTDAATIPGIGGVIAHTMHFFDADLNLQRVLLALDMSNCAFSFLHLSQI